MLVIGIDPGTAITGYGLLRENEDGSLYVVDYGAILTSSEQPMSERLLELHRQLSEILLLHQPDSGAVEKLFFHRNVTTALSVGQARGVTLLAMAAQGPPPTSMLTKEILSYTLKQQLPHRNIRDASV